MTAEQFSGWLQGMHDATDGKFTKEQWGMIFDKVKLIDQAVPYFPRTVYPVYPSPSVWPYIVTNSTDATSQNEDYLGEQH